MPTIELQSISIPLLLQKDASEIAKLRRAVCEVGFFSIRDVGVDTAPILRITQKFFSLPLEEKMKIHMSKSQNYRGYTVMGEEITLGKPDYKEVVDFGKEESQHPPPTIRGPNLWPVLDGNPVLVRDTVETYISEMNNVGLIVLRSIALALGEDEEYFARKFKKPSSLLRMIRYPPTTVAKDLSLEDNSLEGAKVGVGEHTDFGALTFICQNGERGLQIKSLNNEWLSVLPREGEMVCNIADSLAAWSGGRLRSTPHRVLIMSPKERISVPFFYEPSLDAELYPGKTYEMHMLEAFLRSYPKIRHAAL